MDYENLITDSLKYTQDALIGKWVRWAIFVIFALPFSLIQFLFDPKTISPGSRMDWAAIPWGQIALLAGAGLVLSFFLSGYLVRIYRGVKPAPDFTGWTGLFVDGVKLEIVWILWFLPLIVVMVAGLAASIGALVSARAGPGLAGLLILLLILLFLVAMVLFVIVFLFGILGAVRFSRTGSIREGIRFSAIHDTIRTIGWGSYIVALIVYIVAAVVYVIVTAFLGIIPLIGWFLVLLVTPFFTIFSARYFALVYEHGVPQAPAAQEPAPAL
ncbi:MAG TPA: DUF4013 domain-containing protein [Methanoregula sp.]|nr:DUF4013 domain-containing protein [Methanoregula sp.]